MLIAKVPLKDGWSPSMALKLLENGGQDPAHRPSMREVALGIAYRPDSVKGREVLHRPAMCKGMWGPLTGLACVKGHRVCSEAWCA